MESKATESRPPERPSARCAPGKVFGASTAATLSGNSLELEFLEFPIAHQALETLLDEFLGTLVGETAQGVGERLLQALGHGGAHRDPPRGSLTILSIKPRVFRRLAVMPSVSAASGALSALFHRIEAQPSGEITE